MKNFTFIFWMTAFYTVFLYGAQMYELLTGQALFNFAAINAAYLGMLSAYVGGKEIHRWKSNASSGDVAAAETQGFRPPGEWFVGLWVISLPVVSLLVQIRPERFTYPQGLTTIALEVLTFYLGSNVSRWLKKRDTETEEALESQLSGESPPAEASASDGLSRRVSRKRQKLEDKIVASAVSRGGLSREEVEKISRLKQSATAELLAGMVRRGLIRRLGEAGSRSTRYEPVQNDSKPSAPSGS